MSASAGPGGIVYEQFGQMHIYDIASGKEHAVNIEIAADLTEVRPHFQNVSRELRNAAHLAHRRARRLRSPRRDPHRPRREGRRPQSDQHAGRDGADAGVVAGRQDRSPTSPMNPASTRCTSSRRAGRGETKKIPLAGKSAFYFDPKWSPDSKAIAFNDNMDNLWMVEIASGKVTKVDTDYHLRSEPRRSTGPAIRSGSRSRDSCPTACAPSRSIRWRAARACRSPMA